MNDLKNLAQKAREISYLHHGKKIFFYIPGMFCYNGIKGNFPAVSITGKTCKLNCAHCGGKLLHSMIPVENGDELMNVAQKLYENNAPGFLLSGGFDTDHTLAIEKFIPAIKKIKEKTTLKITLHCGIIDRKTCILLKDAGIDQALVDVIGADETIKNVYKTDRKIDDIIATIENLVAARIPVIPHVVAGIDFGRIIGEYRAIEIIAQFPVKIIVFVSLMPLPGTPMEMVKTPSAEDIARLMIYARFKMPHVEMALGCARKRGYCDIDLWAIECGINRIALPADEAIVKAKEYRLFIEWCKTCCSI
ncbi:MAG: radical SAM protein [candidate division WOR-3 bacterium]|nr:radical SAM protein [candidate division WOR-3 bacterium]